MLAAAAIGLFGLALGRIENEGKASTWSPFIPFDTGCNCDWIHIPGACNNNDGSPCWSECCKGPGPAPPSPGPDPGCDCSWTGIPGACNHDDGSVCWKACCNPSPVPPGPTPTPGPPTPPGPPGENSPVNLVNESNNQDVNNGFQRTGGMRYHSQEKLNLLGGSMTMTVDLSRVKDLVNANAYLVIPGTLMNSHFYCDNSKNFVDQGNACIELDIFESNGHQLVASTMHTYTGYNTGGCDTYGCRQLLYFGGTIDGNRPFDVRVEVSNDGNLTVQLSQDGKTQWAFNNGPGFDAAARAAIVDGMQNHGAILMSSLWTGWVPPNQVGNGDLGGSTYALSNIMYTGRSMGRV